MIQALVKGFFHVKHDMVFMIAFHCSLMVLFMNCLTSPKYLFPQNSSIPTLRLL